jgi:alanine racemase
MADAHGGWLTPTLYTAEGVAAARAVCGRGVRPWPVHVKVNTGMNRVGAEPGDVGALARMVADDPGLVLEGLWTHLAVADEPERMETAEQLRRFGQVVTDLRRAGASPEMLHVANSAAALVHPATRLDMVRCGISIYGVAPAGGLADGLDLRPAMSVTAAVSFVKRVRAGESVSYGLRCTFERDTNVATVPVGYADGVSRRLGETGGEVLVRGRRRPIVGSVTMDQIMVSCGDDEVGVGDEVVLLGSQGEERIGPDEWARRLGTIPYEVICGFGPRLPRVVERPAQPPAGGVAARTVTVGTSS